MNRHPSFAMMKRIALVGALVASPALAVDAPNGPPTTFEPQPPCTGGECEKVFLQVQNQCVWAESSETSPVILVLTLANGATMQLMLKSPMSYTAANAPYKLPPQCESIENMVQTLNARGHGDALVGDTALLQQLKACHDQEMAARDAELKKDEYYSTGSRMVLRRSTIGTGGTFRSTEGYAIYSQRLKNGTACLDALHDIKSFTAAATQTIGSWVVSGATGTAKAVPTPAAVTLPVSGSPAPGGIIFQLELEYGGRFRSQGAEYQGSSISISNGMVPLSAFNTVFHVLADGKDVGQLNGAGFDLRTSFGADLAGLASVQQIAVVGNNAQTGNTTFFTANLQQTAAALAAMKTFTDAM